jgi:glycolate oxidase iron-sulfur subunit
MATPTRAFDDHRPPAREHVDACVHCGFCLPTCPTYVLWGEEMDSPRGRIVLMEEGLREGSSMTAGLVTHLDRCLGCMACVTACPSGVQYDRLIEAARPQIERNHPRDVGDRAFRAFLYALFTHPGRLRAVAPAVRAAQRLGLPRLVRHPRLERRFPRLAAMARMAPPRDGAAGGPLPAVIPARGARRGRVALLQGCVQRVFFARINRATAFCLSAEGFEVVATPAPRCCGALHLHGGAEPEAKTLARRAIAALEGFDAVVVNAAGCGSAMKGYGHLLSDEPRWAERAASFSRGVRDVSEFLAGVDAAAPRHPVALRVAYHDACHLAHAQAIRQQPRALLRSIPGLEVLEPAEWEICCGSAGVYNLLQPEAGAELGRRKAANLLATGAEAIAAGNPGCALQIHAHLEAAGRPLPVYHPVELLARSIAGPGTRSGA